MNTKTVPSENVCELDHGRHWHHTRDWEWEKEPPARSRGDEERHLLILEVAVPFPRTPRFPDEDIASESLCRLGGRDPSDSDSDLRSFSLAHSNDH